MAKNAATHPSPAPSSASQPADSRPALAPVIEINVRHIGRTPQPEKLTGSEAPEGWIKRIDRPREGKVWVGFFHLYVADPSGRAVRRKKEKTLGPATMPKHEAQQKLADYIEEYTGKLIHQGESIESFAELWKAFAAVKAGSWGKKMREDMKYLFDKHVLPVLGQYSPRKITLTPLQLLVNKMAEDGYSRSAVKHIRTYLKACFEYAIDEDLIPKNPARKLALPNIHKKPCERFLSVAEVQALLTAASPREHLVVRILAVCGLRPGEALALRIDDFEGNQLRIDEALKERQLGEDRIGDTKTDESDSYVPVPPDLEPRDRRMDRGSSATRQSAGVSLSQSQRKSLQRRQLFEETIEASREECRHPRSDTAGVPTHILHAHPKTRHGQGHAASPEAFGPRDDAKALRQGDSREPAHRGRSPGCADHRIG